MGAEKGTIQASRAKSPGAIPLLPTVREPTVQRTFSSSTDPGDRAAAEVASRETVLRGKNLGRNRSSRPVVGAQAVSNVSGDRIQRKTKSDNDRPGLRRPGRKRSSRKPIAGDPRGGDVEEQKMEEADAALSQEFQQSPPHFETTTVSPNRPPAEDEMHVDELDESQDKHLELNESQDKNLGIPLIEAVLVPQESFEDEEKMGQEIVQAQMVKASDSWFNPKTEIFLIMILLLIAIVVVMAVVLVGNKGDSGGLENEDTDQPTPLLDVPGELPINSNAPTPTPINASTPTPTTAPTYTNDTFAPTACRSNIFLYDPTGALGCKNENNETIINGTTPGNLTEAPSAAPSLAPTFFDLGRLNWTDTLNLKLPNQTILAIQDPSSPQSLAYDWIVSYPGIDNMTEWRKHQLFAMATIFQSLNGDGWVDKTNIEDESHESLNWLNYSLPECRWGEQDFRGTQCNNSQITQIWIDDIESMRGPMPPEVALLTSLEKLGVENTDWNSSLDDAWPVDIAAMSDLDWLHYENCKLTGTIPTYVGTFTQLERLRFNLNYLVGPLPTEIGLLTSLQLFYPSENRLTGTLPVELAGLTELTMMRINGNSFEGPVPTEFGNMRMLSMLSMFENSFSGALPSEIGLLTELTHLTAYSNKLTGTIPTELGRLTRLEVLWLYSNNLLGPVPSELGQLTELTSLKLQNNELTSSMPSEICELVDSSGLGRVEVACARLTCPEECCSCCGSTTAC